MKTHRSLWRNRDFALLTVGELLSGAGTQLTTIAYPLLVLALTGSAAEAGVVGFARLIPFVALGLFAGLAADRWDRRRIIVAADLVRAIAVASLGATIVLDEVAIWHVGLVAFVEGAGATFSGAARPGALRAVVPRAQLPDAVGVQQARHATVNLVGPPLGGALFGLGRAVPFLVDAATYTFSIVSVLLMRTPFQEPRELDAARLRTQLAEGFRFLWRHPFLRTTALLYGLGNFTIPAVLFAVIVIAEREGLAPGEIGLLVAVFGAATLAGSLASPLFRRAFSMRTIILLELWIGLGTVLFLVWPSVYVLAAATVVHGVTLPVTDSVVGGYRIAITPDRLLGRAESVRSNISRLTAPFGPLVAGLLLSEVSARATIAFFAALSLALAIWGTLSRPLRDAPSLRDLVDDFAGAGTS